MLIKQRIDSAASACHGDHLERLLRQAEEPARRVLAQFEAAALVRTSKRQYRLQTQTADQWPHALPPEAPPAAHRAADLLRHAREVRDRLFRNDAGAVEHALSIALLAGEFVAAGACERKAG